MSGEYVLNQSDVLKIYLKLDILSFENKLRNLSDEEKLIRNDVN